MKLTRRSFAFGASAAIAMPHVARAQTLTDSAGRSVNVPARVERVFPAGPPAAITHYTLQPRTLLGWPRANRGSELVYLDPEVGTRPELGRLTGRGNTTNLEVLLALKPSSARWVTTAVVILGAVAVIAAGIAGAVIGERDIEHHGSEANSAEGAIGVAPGAPVVLQGGPPA